MGPGGFYDNSTQVRGGGSDKGHCGSPAPLFSRDDDMNVNRTPNNQDLTRLRYEETRRGEHHRQPRARSVEPVRRSTASRSSAPLRCGKDRTPRGAPCPEPVSTLRRKGVTRSRSRIAHESWQATAWRTRRAPETTPARNVSPSSRTASSAANSIRASPPSALPKACFGTTTSRARFPLGKVRARLAPPRASYPGRWPAVQPVLS